MAGVVGYGIAWDDNKSENEQGDDNKKPLFLVCRLDLPLSADHLPSLASPRPHSVRPSAFFFLPSLI